jgi:rRNA small subunit pseudouridine methyltransferase Nep1
MRSSPESAGKFVFVLAESELELIPDEILSEKAILSSSKSRGKRASSMLLDASYHHSAMKPLEDGERRGRPDITHFFLLLCLDSRLNHAGKLKIIIHTRNDERISVSPDLRLPPSYHRFVGLAESLFQNGAVPSKEEPLMRFETGWSLPDVLKAEKCDRVVVLDAGGAEKSPAAALSAAKEGSTAVVIGGFPSGSFHSDISSLKPEVLSLGGEMLKVWTVASEMLSAAFSSVKGS